MDNTPAVTVRAHLLIDVICDGKVVGSRKSLVGTFGMALPAITGEVQINPAVRRGDRTQLAAQIYRDNIDEAPTMAVAQALDVSRRTASRLITEAREQGLLPVTTQGKKQA
ncbi:MAG TPA: DUF6214 family protein [Acidimicrobiales bacterium]|nr:DUF6214 family protein [Acidimicrobiales bacterium]